MIYQRATSSRDVTLAAAMSELAAAHSATAVGGGQWFGSQGARSQILLELVADALPLRIFLASPGDLENERRIVRRCVEEHSARRRSKAA
jgi:hypothetical protein